VTSNSKTALIDKERRKWATIAPLGKRRFVLRTFAWVFAALLLATSAQYLLGSIEHSVRRISISFGIDVAVAVAYTVIAGFGTWEDLERKFRDVKDPDSAK